MSVTSLASSRRQAAAALATISLCMALAGGCAGDAADPGPPSAPAAAGPATVGPASAPAAGEAMVVGRVPPPAPGLPTIVVLEPETDGDLPVPVAPQVMNQVGMAFVPELLLVRAGQAVRFRNLEDELHNVDVTESATGAQVFNVATTPFGAYDHTFERPGFYAVNCDVHPAMRATILVTKTPHATVADRDGRFVFAGVAPGSYLLTVHSGRDRTERTVEIAGPRTALVLDAGGWAGGAARN